MSSRANVHVVVLVILNGVAWKIKQSFLPPHPLFHLTQQFFLVHGVFKENTFTGIDKKEKNHQGNRAG